MAISLTINGTSFKAPNSIQRVKEKNVRRKRSLNGTLNTDILDFTKKETLIMNFDILTASQLSTLETWIDTGAYTVVITDTDYAYNASSQLSYSGYDESFAGYKKGVKVTVQQI